MNRLRIGWFVCGAFAITNGGCSDSDQHGDPITTAGTGAIAGTGSLAGQSGTGTQPVPAGTGIATAGSGVATAGAGGTQTAGTSAVAGSPAGSPTAGMSAGAGGMTVAGAGGAAGAQGAGAGGTTGMMNMQTLPPITDYTKAGPFKTKKELRMGPGSSYTIFRPDPLGENGFLHSPIIFGPGIITDGANNYDAFLSHLATHGYVVMSVNTLGGPPGAADNDTAMKEGLDWLIQQNSQAGVYQGKLAADRAISMGYSIGATSAVLISSHPAIVTSVAIHGHMQMTRAKPHGPVLLFTGNGETEIPAGPQATIEAITTVPVILGLYDGQAHVTVIADQLAPGKPEFTVTTAWLRYWVNGDDAAKRYFWGDNCEICSDAKWMVTTNAAWDAQKL